MSKRISVIISGRKVLTKVNDGQALDQFLAQINTKHNTSFSHVWLSENGNEDLDVVDNGETIYLTEGSAPPVEEAKTKGASLTSTPSGTPSLTSPITSPTSTPIATPIATPLTTPSPAVVVHPPADNVPSLSLESEVTLPIPASIPAPHDNDDTDDTDVASIASDTSSNISMTIPNINIDRMNLNYDSDASSGSTLSGKHNLSMLHANLHTSLLNINHLRESGGDSTDNSEADNNSSSSNRTGERRYLNGSNGSNPNSIGNGRSISNSGGYSNPNSIGGGASLAGDRRSISLSPALMARPRSNSGNSKLSEVVTISDFLADLDGFMGVFEPKGKVLMLGIFSLDFEEAIHSYTKNPNKKKREQFMDKPILNATSDEPYVMLPGDIIDIGVGHNTIVCVNEAGQTYVAGAYLLVPACLGQAKARVAPSPPFPTNELLSIDVLKKYPTLKIPKIESLTFYSREVWTVSSGANHSAAITRDNEVITWGYNINCLTTGHKAADIEKSIRDKKYVISGQLGHSSKSQKATYFALPQIVEGLSRQGEICQVACGGAHTAALTADGLLFTWGSNDEGQLGWTPIQIKQYPLSVPNQVIAFNKIRIAHVACGSHHTIVCDTRGKVYAWGYNNKGQLGAATQEVCCSTPQLVAAVSEHKVEMVAAGIAHSMVLTDAGLVLTWGSNDYGELGRTKNKNRPDQPSKLSDFVITHIAAGPHACAAVTDEGTVFIWGKLAEEKMAGHEAIPRMIQSFFDKKYFVCKVGVGAANFVFLTDEHLTSMIESYLNYCDEKIAFSHEELTQYTLDLSPQLLKRVQTRVYKNMLEKRKDAPIIKVNKAQLLFGAGADGGFTAIEEIVVTNIAEGKVNIKGSLDLSGYKNSIAFEPKSFEGVKPGQSVTFKVSVSSTANLKISFKDLFCFVAEPAKGTFSGKSGGGIRYFMVYNFDERPDSPRSESLPTSPVLPRPSSRFKAMLAKNPSASLQRSASEKPQRSQSIVAKDTKYHTLSRNNNVFANIDFNTADLEIFERLGSGGSLATVWRCTLNGFTCAMKELQGSESTKEVQDSFLNEITLIESLSHENIVRYLGHYVTPSGNIRLFMEYYPMSLADLIKKRKIIPAVEAKVIARDVAKGLEYLHKQLPPVIHRDIKPGNCLIALDQMERVKVVKITDFDISKALFEGGAAMTCAGTTIYMAPEVFSGKSYGIEADVWSFGMMMIEIFTGKHPYHQHKNFDVPKLICEGVLPDLTPEVANDESYKPLVDIVYQCFKDVKSRPSAKDLVVQLLAIM